MYQDVAQSERGGIAPHERYAMIVDMAYELGEARRRQWGVYDPQQDWIEASAAVDSRIQGEE